MRETRFEMRVSVVFRALARPAANQETDFAINAREEIKTGIVFGFRKGKVF